jgi:hypothetical protein
MDLEVCSRVEGHKPEQGVVGVTCVYKLVIPSGDGLWGYTQPWLEYDFGAVCSQALFS